MKQTSGELSLTFRRRESGKTYLAEQYFKLPLQVMTPFYQDEDGTAFVYLLNPSGGILQNDRLYTEITLEEKAQVLVATPSATKFYKMEEGHAEIVNRITVKAGGVMEYLPEHNVPYAKARVFQENDFYLDRDSVLMASDLVTAGRVSMGEVFGYDVYASRTRIFVDGKLRVYDNSLIEPGKMELQQVGLMEGYLSNGTIYVYAPEISGTICRRLNELPHPPGIYFAAGMIEEDLMIVRFLGDSMIELQQTVQTVWDCLRREILGKPAVRIRKY